MSLLPVLNTLLTSKTFFFHLEIALQIGKWNSSDSYFLLVMKWDNQSDVSPFCDTMINLKKKKKKYLHYIRGKWY